MDKKVEIEKIYMLSSMQEGMLFHYLLQEDSQAYFEQMVFSIDGKLDIEIFEQSFNRIIERYDIFRTNFVYQKLKKAQQIVFKKREIKLYYEDISGFKDEEKHSLIEGFKFKDKKRGFNLSKEALIRIAIFKTSNEEYKLVWSYHHILMDGWCLGIVMKEILEIYKALSDKKSNELEKVPPYSNYIKWLKQQDTEEGLSYWKKYLGEYEQLVEIPKFKNRSINCEYIRKEFNLKLEKNITEELTTLAIKNQVTMNTILQTTWGILLQKYNNVNDAVFGAVVSGRPAEVKGIERMVGLFINTIPVRIKGDKISFIDLIKEVQKANIESEKYSYYPLYEIQANTTIKQELINNILVFENYPVEKEIENLNDKEEMAFRIKDIEIQEQTNYDFNTVIALSNNQIILKFLFNNNVYDERFVEKVGEHFVNILKCVLRDDKVIVKDIEILSIEEKSKILYEFNNTHSGYARDKTIHELFEEQVEKTPDNIAIIFEDKELTYRELNEKSNNLARTLRKKGVKADSIVGIMTEKSIEMIVGIMAILKAGGAYLPIEPDYPEDRIRYMLKDSNSKLLLIQESFIEKSMDDVEIVKVNDENLYRKDSENLVNIAEAYNIAYVIYTSGTTGKPKGVMVEHKSLNNCLFNIYKKFNCKISSNDRCLSLTNISFDVSVAELFIPLLNNATLVLFNNEKILDIQKLSDTIVKKNITFSYIPPTILKNVYELLISNKEKLSLNKILVGVEPIKDYILEEYMNLNSHMQIINGYGPTEATICATMYKYISGSNIGKNVPIGEPMLNTRIYIVDNINKIVPIGVAGELCISGDGLARGYIKNEELTAEKFVQNPYESEEKMYRTGDLARWLPDGNIEFLGRIDHQVKIRGFRIELGEVEGQLLQHEHVKETVVLDREDENGSKYLCAYVISKKELTVGELRAYLSKKLPEYMIPSYFVQLDKMPLTPNGKIDRKALPKPGGSILTGAEYEAARNEVEEKLTVIWSEVLGVERVGINDNFFELGGHSLKATTLVSIIHKELNVEVPIREIFKFPTIKGICEYIESTQKSIYSSIELAEEKEYYEASSAQKRMYMLQQFDLDSTGYNIPGVMIVEGRLESERLEKSFNELIRRHETLRTSFETIEDKIVQRVNKSVNFKLSCFEVECIESTEKAVDNIVKDLVKAFDLNKAPLLRVGLIKLEEDKHILMFDIHHIISDGVSMGILTNEFAKIYEGNKLGELKIQYKDYSQWQNSLLKSEVMQEQKEYWKNIFKDEIPVLNMPTDFQRPLVQSFEGEDISFKLDTELTKSLKWISNKTGSTMYMILLSGVNILLSKYSGQEDIIVGSPIAGRPHADLEKIIGMFVNTLAMRNHPEGSRTYEDFLKEVKETALKAYENQDYQFDELVDKLSIPRDISRNPLFDVMFTMQNMDLEETPLKDLVFRRYKQGHKTAKFDLTFFASEAKGEIAFELQYSTKLYKRETIERMVKHFVNILKVVAADTKIKLSEIDVLTEGEKHKLLFEFNDTYAEYPRDKTIHELFEEQVEKNPDTIAVVFEDKEITYRELNERANRLAKTLREKGVKADSIVGIMVERSFEMIVGVMAVLKAGGAYLPIDPWYPEERIKYTLTDSNTNILLTQRSFAKSVEFKGNILDIEDESMYSKNGCNLENISTSKNLAYVIYTSGSTGKPKGVIIEHGSSINTLVNMQNEYPLIENDSYLMKTAYTFDVSVAELFGWFMRNGRLIILNPGVEKDPESIINVIEKYKITHINFVPSMLDIFVDALRNNAEKVKSLKYVFVAGEAISRNLANKFLAVSKTIKLENIYGPTEAIYVTRYSLENLSDELNVPIGKPFSNTRVYIVDRNNKIQPIGVIGELCIWGEGLARGYLNKPELTAEKFIESPFVSGERMYKTGDLARWLPDGNIEFLGRIDHQVKIRGFRIELGEIESQLLNHESVEEAVVIDREDENGAKYLCAYLVSEKELTVGELREYLSKKLPEYMIPSYFVQLDQMPLTPNGKMNRKALPKPDGSIVTGSEYEAARNEVEESLVEIWKEVLAAERVGINDNFFELGGHSLKATTLVSKIHKELNVAVPLREIFKFPTIKGISEYIGSTQKSIYSSIGIVEEKEYYEASSAQKRMYILQQFDLKSTGYNMPGIMLVEGRLEAERLEKSFIELVARHETLRTSFETIEDKIVQRVSQIVNFKLNCFEVSCIENEDKSVDNIVKDFVKAFNLNNAPLLRVGLIKLEEDKNILMFDMHHIISDGVSMGILVNEFAKIYKGDKLDQLRIQYKDYSEWQNSLLKSEVMQEQKKYWIDRFSNERPVLNMPTDFIRPTMQSFEGENISFKLDTELTKILRRMSKDTGSTMYMVLLSAVNILLSKYSGQEDIIVGSPIAGRPHADLLKIIGMFVNTLAMRNQPEGSRTYEDFLKEVKENALKAYENQDYQFDELVDKLSIPRDISRNPLFDVMFTMQNLNSDDIELKDLVFKGYKQEHNMAKFDLAFSASEMIENIILSVNYSTKLYKKETIETMIEHFVNILKTVVADTKVKISKIDMLTEGEKHKLLYEFNDTYADYPREKTIHELFEEQVKKTPDDIAIVFEDKEISYRELNEKANRLARTLREKGIKPDSIVAIMVERSIEMIVGIMGILKAGGAYLPMDPGYPEDRIRYMIEDSNTNIILTQSNLIGRIEFHEDIIDLQDEEVYSQKVDNLEKINTSKDLAYVIYTSGSTGNPKGVMVEHRNVSNVLTWFVDKYKINKQKNVMNLTEYTFDPSVEQIFTTLISGAKLYIPKKEVILDKSKFATYITSNKINVMNFVPAMIKELLLDNVKFNTLDTIIVGGEKLEDSVKDKLMKLGYKVFNHYGPTETTIDVLSDSCKEREKVTLGRPIQNTEVYILDKGNNSVPIGVEGELCISGEGLARGYLNRPELTLEKFIENPFALGKRMYKTGDLARWLPNGSIEFLGRIDYQVKIRGFRIELGEIESQLLNYEDIKETIVVDREDENGAKYLCAYLVSEKELTVGELRNYLSKKLPEYMIPSYFVQLCKLQFTSSGKIDRKALPQPDGSIVIGAEYEAARNEVEEKLVAIWKEVLSAERVGINDNFFELGGHSLKATTLVSKIHKELNVAVPLREVFKFPTIKGTSEYIESTEKSIYSSLEVVEDKEYYEASSAQKRMYMLQQFDLKGTVYNMPGVMVVEGKLNVERLEESFTLLIRRHETLRTYFETIEDKIVQRINESVNFKLNYFVVGCIESQEKTIDNIIKDFVKAFDLNKAPLLRVGLIKLEEDKHILMFDMHHIISDGVSIGILTNEFAKIYEGSELEHLRIQYKDYSQWQNSLLQSEVMQEQKEYWTNRFKDEIPVINMPTDFQRPLMQSFEGENVRFKLDKELTKDLKQISKETGSTMYMVLLSGINILLSKYSGQEDIIVGSPIAGRPHADLLKIIGMFVNTLAMRNHIDGDKTYEDFLKEVKENALKAYENQDYQFDELVDKLSITRDISRNPLFDVMFTMQNIDSEEIELKDLIFKGYKQEHKAAKFDLTFTASEMVEDIILNLQYSTKLYRRETIETMIEHLVNILKAVATDTKVKLSKINMLTEQEKHKLLYEFNGTYVDYPRNKTIHELFEEQAEKTPDNVAVVFEDKKLTYRELNEKANKLARTLREKGVKPNSIVGIMVERSVHMIVGIVGVLKAGGAYLPIEPGYPEERIKYMLEDGRVEILLSQSKLKVENIFKGELLDLEDERCYKGIGKNLDIVNSSRDLAYIIYTSGSTGKPKGVMIEHKNVLSLISALFNDIYSNYGLNLNIALVAPYVFDASVKQIFPAILLGHKLFIVSEEARTSGESLLEYYNNNLIDISDGTPIHINMLVNARCKENTSLNVKCFIIGGDVFTCETVRKFTEKFSETKPNIVNIYGPTECCVDSIFYNIDINKIKDLEIIPIGKPMCNELIYILGKNQEILPVGIVGEIYISGEGVGRGYLNRPELTSEKFIENPFVAGERMYKTGDLAKWLPDGNVEFHGRIDHQVKVRGFRIELDEIESQLLNYESVKEVIVLGREDENGDKYLCAYLVSEKELTVGELREYLSKKLPEYMIPSYFMQLDKMPLTPNGKTNRKALPKPNGSIVTGSEYEVARNEVEEDLVEIWKEVLAVERVGINDNFFELGGHSLKAITLVSKIHKELNVAVPLREIFKFPTIKGISEYIGNTEKSIYSSIGIVEEMEYYEASSAQKRMYMLQQFDLDSTGYNMPGVIVVEGRINVQRLEKSFAILIRRHETLRTSFETIEDKIVQIVHEGVNFKLNCFEAGSIESQEKDVDNILKGFVKAFDLNKAPLLRVGLIKLKEEKHILMFDMHHIISDGVSMGILTNEFAKVYEGNELEQLRVQYKDYSQWQNDLLKSNVMQEQKEYWINRFKDEIPMLNMPIDFKRPVMQSFEGDSISFKLDKELTKDLKMITKETGSTMYMVLLSGVNILLSKYSGQEDIVVGSPIAGRPHADLLKIIGMFVNTLAMRNYPEGSRTYEDFLKEVKENALKAYENQDYQFDELVDKLSIPRDIGRNPLFDVMFTMQNIDSEEIELKDLIFKGYKQEHKVSKFDLTFSASEVMDEIVVNLEYCTKLYKRETIERMAEHFVTILKTVAADTKIELNEIDILTEGEKHKLLFEFNDTYADYPRDKTIHELFQEQVKKTPENIAIVFENKEITYRELNERANRLAGNLREKGVKPDSIVGIMVEHSDYMLVGIMGVLKAGGAYLPIDPEYPEDRIKYMLEDSNTKILLTQKSLLDRVEANVTVLDIYDENMYAKNGYNLVNINTSRDLAYVIYTSGSTGRPKGVMVEHRALINLCKWHNKNYEVTESDKVAKYAGIGFDASVWEMFPYIIEGASIHIIEDELRVSVEKLNKYYEDKGITIGFLPTFIFEQFIELENKSVKRLLTGADKLRYFKNKPYELYNNYGPTEYTVVSTSYKVNKYYENIPIGKPISNTRVYVLDINNKIMPIGIPGELCISGDGLARGYLNNETLSLEKFISNPYEVEQKMYKTGDLVRYLADGNIEFLGRIDHQVKIRGFRIELGEIENQLLNHKSIKEAIVIDIEEKNGTKYLCAYLVSEKELTVGELRAYLSRTLPEYMIPSYFVQLEKMPLTPNGKVDKKALSKPDGSIVTGAEYEVARNEVEEKLVAIWQEVLGVERVGINDNFFELGGHSLKATTLVSRIHKALNVEVTLREIFKFPTIKGTTEYIVSTEKSIYSSIEIVEEKEYYEASSAQKRMYMLQQFDLKSTGYNIPGVMVVEGRLEAERLEKAFNELIRRHETLRTSFEIIEDKIVQRVKESVSFKLQCFEVSCIEGTDEAIDNILKDFVKAFDLNKAPLLRVGLIKLGEDKHILMSDMHHIISDGVSMGILTNEFAMIYEGNELAQLRIQYKDYSQWQNSLLKSKKIKNQEEYWKNRFSNEIPVLKMRGDYVRPILQSFEGDSISFKLDKELTKGLNKVAKETGSTMYMVLLSGVNILLSKYSGQEDIVVGSPIAGRPHADLLKIIGMFVNTLAMRNYPEGSRTYEDFLKEVKENALKAYENQDYQFDELVDKLSIPRDIGRNPLFDVMFTMQNIDSDEIKLKDLVFKGYKQEHKVAKFDLTFSASEMVENIILNLQYSTKLYKRETIETMIGHFVNILKAVASDTKIKLSEIGMLTEGEKHKLLYKFNETYADYPRGKAIHELFQDQVEKTPDTIAVVFEDKEITYRELNEKANRLARNLREKGVKPNSIVGIMVGRSVEMIVGIMAVLKAGGAYLPIDPECPEERIKYMVENGKVEILLIQSKLKEKITFKGELLDLEDEKYYRGIGENLDVVNSSRDLAYVIFTSGSTGKPKGVMIEHKNVLSLTFALLKDIYSNYGLNLNIALVAPYVFDASVKQIFPAILLGHKLLIAPEEARTSGESLLEYYNNNAIDISDGTPIHMNMLVNARYKENTSLNVKCFIIGGDVLPCETVRKFLNKLGETKPNIVNIYGPTECCVDSIFYDIDINKIKDLEIIPIGKPMCNELIYILGKNLEILPMGVVGEIYISGEGVGRGYLNNPELTAEKFMENPFVFGEKMYKTGDLARWLSDGNIEFLGRIDHQVKIRGFRIELGEIESQLLTYEKVKEAVVIDRIDKEGDKYLCAYVVCESEISSRKIKHYLSGRLPAYMIPSHIIQLENVPVTLNGKVDRNALNRIEVQGAIQEQYIEPRTEGEFAIIKAWEEVLGINKIGVTDNFFDLGGDSIKAIRVVMNLSRDYEIAVNDIFQYQTPTSLAQNIYFKKDALRMKLEKLKEMPNEFNEIEAMKNKVRLQVQLNEYEKANKRYKNINLTAITTYNNILITGATGYLGIHVLYEILKSTSSNIYLIIRGNSKEAAEEKLIKKLNYYFDENIFEAYKYRLHVLEGDLSKDYLGLDKESYYKLSEVVDCIINSAANVKHYGKYEDLYDTNVKGTNNLIVFAKLNKLKDLNHVSTVSIGTGLIKDKKVTLFTEYDCDMGQETENYYIKTKLEGELAVLKAREDGLNCNIFRVGNLVFNSNTGKFQENVENNAFYAVIKAQLNLKLMPKISSDVLEFSFIDYVSKAIVLLFDKSNLKNEVYHIKNSQLISYNKLGEFIQKIGYPLQLVFIDEFIEYISSNYDKEGFSQDIEKILLHLNLLGTEGVTQFALACDKTQWILSKLGFEWKQLSEGLVRKMMKHGEEVGFFKPI